MIVIFSQSTFPLSGATKLVYAPEPFDVGRYLEVDIVAEDQTMSLTTAGPIDPGQIFIFILHFKLEFIKSLVRFEHICILCVCYVGTWEKALI